MNSGSSGHCSDLAVVWTRCESCCFTLTRMALQWGFIYNCWRMRKRWLWGGEQTQPKSFTNSVRTASGLNMSEMAARTPPQSSMPTTSLSTDIWLKQVTAPWVTDTPWYKTGCFSNRRWADKAVHAIVYIIDAIRFNCNLDMQTDNQNAYWSRHAPLHWLEPLKQLLSKQDHATVYVG